MARLNPPTSFSAGRRWSIFFSVLVSTGAVAALVVMLNYLGARHYLRFSWSAKTSLQLSPQTLGLLESITNDVKVTIYFDKTDSLYNDVAELLNEYHLANPKISVRTVDYDVENAAATEVKNRYNLASSEDKDLLIYEYNGQELVTSGDALANYSIAAAPDDSHTNMPGQPRRFIKGIDQFDGEGKVDADLLRVTGPPLNAYYLTGHGEYPLEIEGQGKIDYSGFASALSDSHITTSTLSLTGTNEIPTDCNLLVIASPQVALAPEELEKIKQYLANGRRLFVLFNNNQVEPVTTGLEAILADWGVQVGRNLIKDKDNITSDGFQAVMNFKTNHPCTSALVGSQLTLYFPRSIAPLNVPTVQGQDPPSVVVLASTGPRASVNNGGSEFPAGGPVPLIVAVERKNVKGVLQQGTTRIIVAGDATFLTKRAIRATDNREFAELAARWLLDQTQYMGGIPPRKVVEYRVSLTHAQMTSIRWIFLGAMPGSILLLGGLVWLRRRH